MLFTLKSYEILDVFLKVRTKKFNKIRHGESVCVWGGAGGYIFVVDTIICL